MSPQPIEFNPPRSVPFPELPRYRRLNHIALSSIVSETLTSLYVSLLNPPIFNDDMFDDAISGETPLNKLELFRNVSHPLHYTYPLWLNRLALATASTIPDIYKHKTSLNIQDQSVLLYKPTRPEIIQREPQYINPSLSLIELINKAIRKSSLIINKETTKDIENIFTYDQGLHLGYIQFIGMTHEAVKITHETLNRLISIRTSSQDQGIINSINDAFYSIHYVAMKIVHNIHVNSFNPFDIDRTLTRTMILLSHLSSKCCQEEESSDEELEF